MSLQLSPLFTANKGNESLWITERGNCWVLMEGTEGYDAFLTEGEALHEMRLERARRRERMKPRIIPQGKKAQLEKIRQMYLAK
jgi:hypothetical protein